jgi:hypothetical protein
MRTLSILLLSSLLIGCSSGLIEMGQDAFDILPVNPSLEKQKEKFPWNGKYIIGVEGDYLVSESVKVIGKHDDDNFRVIDSTFSDCKDKKLQCWIIRPMWRVRLARELQSERLILFFKFKFGNRPRIQ